MKTLTLAVMLLMLVGCDARLPASENGAPPNTRANRTTILPEPPSRTFGEPTERKFDYTDIDADINDMRDTYLEELKRYLREWVPTEFEVRDSKTLKALRNEVWDMNQDNLAAWLVAVENVRDRLREIGKVNAALHKDDRHKLMIRVAEEEQANILKASKTD